MKFEFIMVEEAADRWVPNVNNKMCYLVATGFYFEPAPEI
jgi:hypothetical protein